MADELLDGGRQKEAKPKVSKLRERQDVAPVVESDGLDWPGLMLLLMQMQEHLDSLTSQDLPKAARKPVDGLTNCAGQLLPVLLTEARKQGA